MGVIIRNIEQLFEQLNIVSTDLLLFRRPTAPGPTKDYSITAQNLVTAIAAIVPPGEDGKSVELQNNGTHIQWRLVGDPTWIDLVSLDDITGPQGPPGSAGNDSKIIAYAIALG